MDELFEQPFVVVAHRGGGEEVAENTIKGIRHALRVGAEVIEIDLRATKDNEIILLHDEDFARVAGIEARPGDLDLAYIKDTILIFDQEPVATLKEALEVVAGKAVLFLEIKEEGIVDKVLELIRLYEAKSWVVVISFLESVIKQVKSADASIKTGLIYNRPPGKIVEAKELGADLVLPRHDLATYKAIAFAHSLGLKVVTWTVNDKVELARLLHDGCDGVATDYPSKFVHIKKDLFSKKPLHVVEKRLKLQLKDNGFFYDLVMKDKVLEEIDSKDELYAKLRKKLPKVTVFKDNGRYYIEGEVSQKELRELLG